MTDVSSSEASLTAFCTLGAVTTAQHLTVLVLQSVEGADPELVAEESMALLAATTARTLRDHSDVAATIGALPLTFRDYVVGGAMLNGAADDIATAEAGSYERIGRKMAFYEAHFPAGILPGPRALKDKMELWMGRISPPGLPEAPAVRMENLAVVDLVNTHLQLVRAFATHQGDSPDVEARS